ncbi:MAG: protein kinase [Chloroflexota bacterium]|nr:protein kinase [Chloroflexota bacterium]
MADNSGGENTSGGIGRVLNGRYQLISVVGGGGMAQVYKSRDNILGRIVAIKVLREQYSTDAQFVARFRREAQAAANLAHPNIVNVYDVGQDGDIHYIVMEYINGESLKSYINRSSPLPIGKAISVAAQILAGLEYAHRSGLIHRDIKPQNVLITPDGAVKVTDFGIAKSVSDLGLTEAGLALGTAHYFSPEQAKGERVVPQSDIYAVGVTLYEMLTGRLPFESENIMGLAYKHISEEAPSVRNLNPSVPPRLDAVILKSMAKDPQQRFGSAAEMEKALRAIQMGGQQPTVEVPVAQVNVQPRARGQQPPQVGARTSRMSATGPATGSLRVGAGPRGAYAMGGAAAGALPTRGMTSPLGSPTSMAVAPVPRAQSGAGSSGCMIAAITFITLGILAVLIGGVIVVGPNLPGFFQERVIPSPTATPTVPTSTPTNTPVPPTNTPTSTPTLTPTATSTPQSVPVPKLVGLRVQDAIVVARQSGFQLIELERIDSVEWPEGVVAQQDPPENSILKQTSQVAVRVSRGPPAFKLPNLTNTDPNEARGVLESTGLRVTIAYEGSDVVPKGIVTRTDPPADTSVKSGQAVTIYISLGRSQRVPELRGTENLELAQQRLEALGLSIGSVTEEDDPNESVPPGAVLRTDPAAGTEIEENGVVNIVLRRRQ